MNWLIRMSRWARNPPSWERVRMVALIIVACLIVFGLERVFGWPEWLTVGDGARVFRP